MIITKVGPFVLEFLPVNNTKPVIIDADDFEKVKNLEWKVDTSNKGIVSTTRAFGDRPVRLSRIVLCCVKGNNFVVDHINRNIFDNRKCNLRKATFSQNNMNRSIQKNNSSGHAGVRWNKQRNVWNAQITINKRQIHLGCFIHLENAVKARKNAEKEYFKEFTPCLY